MKKPKTAGQIPFGVKSDEFQKAIKYAQSWKKKFKKAEDIPSTLIPHTYDFRNIKGLDFTGPLRDQGDCGGCYTFSFVQSIEMRLKLKYGHTMKGDITPLSP